MLEIFIALFTLLSIAYLWYVSDFGYWRKQGIPYLPGSFPWGNLRDIFLLKKTMGEVFTDIYRRFPKSSACGYFGLAWPVLMIRDPELVKTVLVKEFAKFHDNGFRISMTTDPMLGINPFVARGNKWKTIRSIHTPTHSANKLKNQLSDMFLPCRNMIQYLKGHGEIVDVTEMSGYYTMDVVGAFGFGVLSNSFLGPDQGLRKAVSGQLFSTFFGPNLASIFAIFAPALNNVFNLRVISKRTEEVFVSLVKDVKASRENSGVKRNDLMQQLIDENCYTPLEMAGHAMTLVLDGSETSATALAYVLYELASHPQVQQALRDEIFSSNFVNLEDITYDKLHGLLFLDMVINETLRLHPPIQVLSRVAVEDTILTTSSGIQIKLKKGGLVTIPVIGLHMDPVHHEEPEKFVPERFSPERRKHMNKFAFIPFGEGPRICVGFRFALTQIKLAVFSIVSEFEMRLFSGQGRIVLDPTSPFLHVPKHGLRLQFIPLQKHDTRNKKAI